MSYVSYDTRKILDVLAAAGINWSSDQNIEIERDTGLYWPKHIIGVIETCTLGKTRVADKATAAGWAYFSKPVNSLLKPRGAAHRTKQIVPIPNTPEQAEYVAQVYRMITGSFVVADFTMDEFKLLIEEIPSHEYEDIVKGCQAAKERGNRTIFYLNGVLKRGAAIRAGTRKAVEEDHAAVEPWAPDTEPLDIGDVASAYVRWQARKIDMEIMKHLGKQ